MNETTQRVLFVGDAHEDADFFLRACRVARREGCAHMIQVGDYGCYEITQSGLDFLRRCEAGLKEYGITCDFIDGNHDGMVPLWNKYGLVPDESNFGEYVQGCSKGEKIQIRENLFYLPRGHRWEWNGVRFMAVGGAYSINRPGMIPGIEWWEEEELTDDQVSYILEPAEDVDVLVSHDIPQGFDLPAIAFKKEYPHANANRGRLLEIVEDVRPKLMIHGHYHARYGNWWTTPHGHRMRIEGLGSNRNANMEEPWLVLDAELSRSLWSPQDNGPK